MQKINTDTNRPIPVSEDSIVNRIYLIRGMQVMLDFDLSGLYEVETKQLKRAVRRNFERFPADFMFELTSEELRKWRCQNGTSNFATMGLRIPPFAFTEHGILMLASVLNNTRAIQINIQVVRIFNKMRKLDLLNKEFVAEIEKIKSHLSDHDGKFKIIYDYLKKFEDSRQIQQKQITRKRVGY